jgi:hypothetical protein
VLDFTIDKFSDEVTEYMEKKKTEVSHGNFDPDSMRPFQPAKLKKVKYVPV